MKSGTTSLLAKAREFYTGKRLEPYLIEKQAFGKSYKFWIGDATGESWYAEANDESSVHYRSGLMEMQFVIDQMLDPADIVFECGAHHGWTTIQLSSFLTAGQVVAFEPLKSNFDILERNLKENQCDNVRSVWAAVAASSQGAKFYSKSNGSAVPVLNSKTVFSRRMLNYLYGVSNVATTSVDAFVDETGLQPSLLKIDVEGFECAVLQGATKTLATRPKLFIEIHTHQIPLYGGTVDSILEIANLQDYRVWLQEDGLQPPVEVSSLSSREIVDRVHLFALPR